MTSVSLNPASFVFNNVFQMCFLSLKSIGVLQPEGM